MLKLYNTKKCRMIPTRHLGKFLRDKRKEMNLSRKELASWLEGISKRLEEEEGIESREFYDQDIDMFESGKTRISDATLGLFAEALGIPWDELMERDTRLKHKDMIKLCKATPGWAVVFNKLLELTTVISPEEAMNRIMQEEDRAFSEEIILANREYEHQLDQIPIEQQIIRITGIDATTYEDYETDKPYKVVGFYIEFGNTVKRIGYHVSNIYYDEPECVWEEGFDEDDEVVLPYLPPAIRKVYEDNIEEIVATLHEKYDIEMVVIRGTGEIEYESIEREIH